MGDVIDLFVDKTYGWCIVSNDRVKCRRCVDGQLQWWYPLAVPFKSVNPMPLAAPVDDVDKDLAAFLREMEL
jgi:hypothetical protein